MEENGSRKVFLMNQKNNKGGFEENKEVEGIKQQLSPVSGPGHAFALSPLKPLFIRRRGGVAAVNGMFLHSAEV